MILIDYLLIRLSGASHGCFGTPCIGVSPLEVENNGNNGNNHHALYLFSDDFTISFSLRRAHLDSILCKSRLSNSAYKMVKKWPENVQFACGFCALDWLIRFGGTFWFRPSDVLDVLTFSIFQPIEIMIQERGHRCERSTSRWSLSPVHWHWWVGLSATIRQIQVAHLPLPVVAHKNLGEFQIPKDWELRQTTTLHSGDTGLDVSRPWLRWDVADVTVYT